MTLMKDQQQILNKYPDAASQPIINATPTPGQQKKVISMTKIYDKNKYYDITPTKKSDTYKNIELSKASVGS